MVYTAADFSRLDVDASGFLNTEELYAAEEPLSAWEWTETSRCPGANGI